MTRNIPSSELIVNPDGSIYHLHLRPEQLADTIITVGDPDRVAEVSKYFDEITHREQKREFVTHTGRIGNKPLSVISTGIGPDNIDIVLNELDALANIDLEQRAPRPEHRPLRFIRIGTTGSLREDVPVDALLMSAAAIGLDNLMHYYDYAPTASDAARTAAFEAAFPVLPAKPYSFEGDSGLLGLLAKGQHSGITLTAPGFYAPQGRALRLGTRLSPALLDGWGHWSHQGLRLSNLEMETSALYGLAHLLGHSALSCSVILANRPAGTFSRDPQAGVERLIQHVLERLAEE